MLQRDALGPAGEHLLQAAAGAGHGDHSLLELLVHTRHAHESRGSRILQRLHQRSLQRILVGEPNAARHKGAGVNVHGLGGHVRKWQVGDDRLRPNHHTVHGLDDAAHIEGDVVVGEHHALGHAHRSGGVDQAAALVDRHILQTGLVLILHVANVHRLDLRPLRMMSYKIRYILDFLGFLTHPVVAILLLQVGGIGLLDLNGGLELGQLVANGVNLVHLLGVVDDHDLGM